MVIACKSFERKFMEDWNYHMAGKLLELHSDDIVCKHQGEEKRMVRGKYSSNIILKDYGILFRILSLNCQEPYGMEALESVIGKGPLQYVRCC